MARPRLPWLCLLLLGGAAGRAAAIEVCDLPPRYGLGQAAIAITRTACNEHRLWQRPFIDRQGRVASLGVTEAESASLADDGLLAWQRVAMYWRESGTLAAMGSIAGASSCAAPDGSRYNASDCRAFLLDNPWSAAFVSWVMSHAGVAGFLRSPRHIDYIRAAYRSGGDGPYRFTDPAVEKPAPGDLLCMLRGRDRSLGFAGLNTELGRGGSLHWQSHCDIVVAANVGGDRTLYLIGGNVLNTVMMRMLPLDRSGRLALPAPQEPENADGDSQGPGMACAPANEDACDFNRHDWAALLKLRDDATLSTPSASPVAAPETPPSPDTGPVPTSTPGVMPPGFPRVVPPRPTTKPL